MPSMIDEHRTQIEEICRRFRVRRLEAFGSVVRDDFDPERSDVDLLVEFEDVPGRNLFHDYMDLREALAELLGRSVDLVMPSAVRNPYIKADIEATRTPLYAV